MQISKEFLMSFIRENAYGPPAGYVKPSVSTSKPIPPADEKTKLSTGIIALRRKYQNPLTRPAR